MELVYFIQSGKAVKIGATGNLENRLKAGQEWNANPIKIIGLGLFEEILLHNRFKKYQIRKHGRGHEWFILNDEIKKFIKENCNFKIFLDLYKEGIKKSCIDITNLQPEEIEKILMVYDKNRTYKHRAELQY